MDEHTDNAEEFGMPPQRLSAHNDSILDFEFESLVDPDDPGFDSEFDSSTSDLEDEEECSMTDSDSSKGDESSLYDSDDSEYHPDEDNIDEEIDHYLRAVAADSQSQHLKQPKSTQLILTTEVFRLFKSYQRHGSAARLSASVMAYLEGGGFATRKTQREVMEKEIDADGNRIGPMTTVTKLVTERVRLNFVPLPKLNVYPNQAAEERAGTENMGATGSKRKASDSDSQDERKRRVSPTDTLGSPKDVQSPVRPRTAGKVFPGQEEDEMDIDVDIPAGSFAMLKHSYNYNQLLHQPGPQNQPRPSTTTCPRQPSMNHQTPQMTPSASIPPHFIQSHPNLTCSPRQYSLTTDQRTQSLLIDIVPFSPLSGLQVTINPTFHQSLPAPCLTALHQILTIHNEAAQKQYASFLDKYTLHPTPSHPNPPQPPAALFRLAITTALHLDLEHLFTSTLEHPLALNVDTRHLLRDLYDNLSPGELNAVEKLLVARAAAIDQESVARWWEDRNRKLLPMFALRSWVADRDVEAIRMARLRGLY